MGTSIEWTDETWNPVTGCTKVSPGCDHCYAERITERFHGKGSFEQVVIHPDRLDKPLHWREPRKVFVNSMSDLFHDEVLKYVDDHPAPFLARVFARMVACERHTFQVLTKRPGVMASVLRHSMFKLDVNAELLRLDHPVMPGGMSEAATLWPGNLWLGTSVEDQHWAGIRIPQLVRTPAAVRFLSCEPLLAPLDLSTWLHDLQWVIVGGESGPGARTMHPDWARSIRDQCVAAGVPFLFKQWGGHTPKAGGRELDGRTWDEYPQQAVSA